MTLWTQILTGVKKSKIRSGLFWRYCCKFKSYISSNYGCVKVVHHILSFMSAHIIVCNFMWPGQCVLIYFSCLGSQSSPGRRSLAVCLTSSLSTNRLLRCSAWTMATLIHSIRGGSNRNGLWREKINNSTFSLFICLGQFALILKISNT